MATQYLSISAGLDDAEITVADWEYTDQRGAHRVCNLNVGRVSLMCGETDEERIAGLTRLIGAAATLRDAAMARIDDLAAQAIEDRDDEGHRAAQSETVPA